MKLFESNSFFLCLSGGTLKPQHTAFLTPRGQGPKLHLVFYIIKQLCHKYRSPAFIEAHAVKPTI